MLQKGIFCFPFFFCPFFLFSQTGNIIFNDTVLHEIRITFGYSTWYDSLQAGYQLSIQDTFDLEPEKEFLCNMVFDGMALDSISMRERGNFSNLSAPFASSNGLKKPFKLVFDAFKNQSFDGLKSLNLNNGTDDPGFVKEPLVYKLLRDRGVMASRTGFAKLYINDAYWGLYEMVEPVDKTFLARFFGTSGNDGNLYKTNHFSGVDLSWQGYDYLPYQKQGLTLKTNRDSNDWSKLIHFIDVLNHTAPGNMEAELSKVFDVESYLQILAVEVVCYSWDSYWGGGNNFYLYEHPDGKIRWMPWDFNETFTVKDGLLGLLLPKQSDIFLSSRFDIRPLLKAIFSVKKWQERYMEILCELCSNHYVPPILSPELHRWQQMIRPALLNDTNALATIQQFDAALTSEMDYLYQFPATNTSFIVKVPGLLPYISEQRQWAVQQIKFQGGYCPIADVEPHAYPIHLFPNPVPDELNLTWDFFATNIYQLFIYNSFGAKVMETSWQVNDVKQEKINVKNLHKGFYILRKQDADGFWGIAKFVKQ